MMRVPTGARHVVVMQVPYLGQRLVDEKGKAGPYHWLSYAEVSKVRTEIGSGLLHYGMKSGSTLGLYSVNCRGACPFYSMECVASAVRSSIGVATLLSSRESKNEGVYSALQIGCLWSLQAYPTPS